MFLKMYIDDVLIDEIVIFVNEYTSLKEAELVERNLELIEAYDKEPVFYIEGIPSKMNLVPVETDY